MENIKNLELCQELKELLVLFQTLPVGKEWENTKKRIDEIVRLLENEAVR